MPLTKSEGLLLSNDELLAGLLENDANRIQLAGCLPFYPVCGDTLRVERASTSDFGVEPLFDTVPVTVTEGVAKPTSSLEAKFELKLLTQNVILNDFVSIDESNVNSQLGVQLEAAKRRMLYKFWKTFYEGDASVSSQEFSGIRKLTVPAQTILANDSVNYFLTLDDLSRLVSLVKACNGRPDVILTSPLGLRNIVKAYHVAGVAPPYVMAPCSTGEPPWRTVAAEEPIPTLSFAGIPILVDEFFRIDETVDSYMDGLSAFAVCLGPRGLCGLYPASDHCSMVRIRELLVAGTAQTAYRLTWGVGLALKSESAIARLQFRPMLGTA